MAKNIVAGGISGMIGTIVGTPGDILRIRMINDLNGTKYKSELFKNIILLKILGIAFDKLSIYQEKEDYLKVLALI